MFYIVQFFKYIYKFKLVGLPLILITVLISTYLLNQKRILKTLNESSITPVEKESYLLGLIDKKENLNRILRKVNSLPGVKKSHKYNNNKLKSKLAKSLNMDSEILLEDFDYEGVKVIFASGTNLKSKELIKEYLVRYVGKDKIVIGKIVSPPPVKTSFKALLAKQIKIVLSVAFVLWVIFGLLFSYRINNPCYLIENFQSKKNVRFKTLSLGFSTLLIIVLVTSYVISKEIQPVMAASSFLCILICSFIYSNRAKWLS